MPRGCSTSSNTKQTPLTNLLALALARSERRTRERNASAIVATAPVGALEAWLDEQHELGPNGKCTVGMEEDTAVAARELDPTGDVSIEGIVAEEHLQRGVRIVAFATEVTFDIRLVGGYRERERCQVDGHSEIDDDGGLRVVEDSGFEANDRGGRRWLVLFAGGDCAEQRHGDESGATENGGTAKLSSDGHGFLRRRRCREPAVVLADGVAVDVGEGIAGEEVGALEAGRKVLVHSILDAQTGARFRNNDPAHRRRSSRDRLRFEHRLFAGARRWDRPPWLAPRP